jgi:hypothetical protein
MNAKSRSLHEIESFLKLPSTPGQKAKKLTKRHKLADLKSSITGG